jgi:hypothetical protein
MSSIPDAPTIFEWVALFQRNSEVAQGMAISLKTRIESGRLTVDPALIISLEKYDRVKELFSKAKEDPAMMQRVVYMSRLGLATMGTCPSREEWATMIEEDPQFANAVCTAWETKCAQHGINTPPAILRSVKIYRDLIAQSET